MTEETVQNQDDYVRIRRNVSSFGYDFKVSGNNHDEVLRKVENLKKEMEEKVQRWNKELKQPDLSNEETQNTQLNKDRRQKNGS